jgi:hypothetical protein
MALLIIVRLFAGDIKSVLISLIDLQGALFRMVQLYR